MKQYIVMGMSCASCSSRIEKAVSKVVGVKSCFVNLLTNSMSVEGNASDSDIIMAVKNAGYDATVKKTKKNVCPQDVMSSEEKLLKDQETPILKKRLIFSLIFLSVLLYISMGYVMFDWPLPKFMAGNYIMIGILQMLLSIAIMIINQKFFISGFRSLIHKSPNMDALVAIGSIAAFVYSVWVLLAMTQAQMIGDLDAVINYMHEFYFETAATILALITVGKMLESHSKGKTTDALKSLMKLSAKNATIIKDGLEKTVPIEQIKKGDIFVVRPGENIPVDGVVIEGSSAINESALTGESIPVDKNIGDQVSAATINQFGFIKCEATRVGEDTTLAQIIQMVSDAAATKAPIAKIADKVSGIFVPVVILIALITFIAWIIAGQSIGFALSRAISVLVISCPCALGLATPVAIMVGNGMGAKNGILFKTAVSLEEAGKIEIVALDKTGTITAGEPKVTDIIPTEDFDAQQLLTLAYALEKKSEHPLAKAIVQKAAEQNISNNEVSEFHELSGNGLTAKLNDKTLLAGSYKFISNQTKISDSIKHKVEQLSEEGKTPLLFSSNGNLVGIIAVADVIKAQSPQAVCELQNMGIYVVMLTGDNEHTANAIGKQVGVDEIIAGVLPNGKESVINSLKRKGKVAMVGDGINDAPALTRADIGIAIGAGTDVAIDAADIVLMKSCLSDIPAAIRLSRATLKNIYENLFWAFSYNIIGIPLAAGVFIPLLSWQLNPMFAAAAMSFSSFFVVTNALHLNLFKNQDTQKDKKIKPRMAKKESSNMQKKTLNIEGMTCGHCEAHVKKALENIDGVETAVVSHENKTAIVTLTKDLPNEILKQAVEAEDYQVLSIS
jgi:copper-(or silver)-translocating P-type ATPase/heavy metal-(Cd/Co/Hg/Pb/Zn)-translocating P-type ATPase